MTEYNVYGKKSYAYAIGRISGTTHRVLRAEEMARLREADSETAQKLLTDYGYPAVTNGKTVYDVIEDEKKRGFRFCAGNCTRRGTDATAVF